MDHKDLSAVDISLLELLRRAGDGEADARRFDGAYYGLSAYFDLGEDGGPDGRRHFNNLLDCGLVEQIRFADRADDRLRVNDQGRAVLAERLPAAQHEMQARRGAAALRTVDDIARGVVAHSAAVLDWATEMKHTFDPIDPGHWFGVIGAATKYGVSQETQRLRLQSFCDCVDSPLANCLYELRRGVAGEPDAAPVGDVLMLMARRIEATGGVAPGGLTPGKMGQLLRTIDAAKEQAAAVRPPGVQPQAMGA